MSLAFRRLFSSTRVARRKFLRPSLAIASAVALAMCGGKTSPKYSKGRAVNGAIQNTSGGLTAEQARLMLTRAQSGIVETQRELEALKEINLHLCQRLNDLRTDCIAAMRVLDDDTDRTLGCSAMDAAGVAITRNVTASLSGGARVKLVADGTYETKPFGNGEPIEWIAKGAASARPPRYMDIGSLQLASVDGTALPPANALGFEYKVNNETLYNGADLVASEAGDRSLYRLAGDRIIEILRNDHCHVNREELEKMKGEVRVAHGLSTATVTGDTAAAAGSGAGVTPLAPGAVAPLEPATPASTMIR